MKNPSSTLRFSLLVATVNRVAEVERFFDSLLVQTYPDFEVILVDQNDDQRLEPVIARFQRHFTIRRVPSARGLSRARNAGLPFCSGDILALPDDDCWYPANLLERVVQVFREKVDVDFISGRLCDEHEQDSHGRWPADPEPITTRNVWKRWLSATIFCRRSAVERTGLFDERLGVGSGTRWGAGEDTDYLVRALNAGASGWYDPNCVVYHPQPGRTFDERMFERALSYGRGIGFVLRKNRAHVGIVFGYLFRPIAGVILSALTFRLSKARFHWYVFRGRFEGLLDG